MRPFPRSRDTLALSGATAVAAVALALARPALADVTFTDTTFNLSNYEASTTYTAPGTTSSYMSGGGTLTFTSTFPASTTTLDTDQGLVNEDFAIDPATQGAVTSIDASVYKDLSFEGGAGTGTFTNTFHPTIEQDGVFYIASIPGPDLTTYPGTSGNIQLSQTGLVASDFLSFDFATDSYGTTNPDFSGDPMLLGLTQFSGTGWYTDATTTAQYQDLSFDVHLASAVPEPGTLALLSLGLVGVIGVGRRRPASAA